MNSDAGGIVQSVHDRLLNRARESGRPFNELLQYYAMERFLYRLFVSELRDLFVLKGGLMLLVWEMSVARTTRDIDLLGRVGVAQRVEAAVAEICAEQVEDDALVFDADSIET